MTANSTRTSKGPKSGMKNMKIVGLKKVIADLNACPEGYHYEVWTSDMNDLCGV